MRQAVDRKEGFLYTYRCLLNVRSFRAAGALAVSCICCYSRGDDLQRVLALNAAHSKWR